jgi:hypothetical protein
MLVQVTPHHQSAQREGRHAVCPFVIGVRAGQKRRRTITAHHVCHLLDADHQRHVRVAAGDGQHALPQRRATRRACRLDAHRPDAAQPGEVGD